ncbi:MAG TPA: hypothetical protein VJK54_07080 [Chthoniobacterales bacterium]|nr:hypothetical protein [Chthoniobacterales bacterium]
MKKLSILIVLLMSSSRLLLAQTSVCTSSTEDLNDQSALSEIDSSMLPPEMAMFHGEMPQEIEGIIDSLYNVPTKLSAANGFVSSESNVSCSFPLGSFFENSLRVDVVPSQVPVCSVLSASSSSSTPVISGKDSNTSKDNALRIYCDHWLAGIGASKGRQPTYIETVIARGGADPELVQVFNKYCHHIKVSLDSGGFLGLSWIQVAEDLQNAIEDSIKKDHEEPRWYENVSDDEGMLYFPNYITPATLQLVKYKDELIRSSVLHQSPEIVNAWENIVRQSQHLVEYHRKSLSCVLEDNKKAPSIWAANRHSKESADLLKQMASNLKKASIADQGGKESLSSLWLNAVNQNLLLLEQLQKTHQSDNFNFVSDQINNATKSSAECLRNSEAIIEEAIKADQRGMREEVILYEKAAFQYQQATDIYQKITETRLALNESLRGFIAAGASTKRSADYLDLAAKTLEDASVLEKHGHQEQALLDRAVAEQYQEAAECEGLAAEAYEQGNIADGDRLHEDANVIVQIPLLRKQALNYKVKYKVKLVF